MRHKLFFSITISLISITTWAQSKNSVYEVQDYKEIDGKIIISCVVNGTDADFVLDLAAQSAILPEYIETLGIDTSRQGKFPYEGFQYKNVATSRSVIVNSISFGNTAFANGFSMFVLNDEPYLKELGVVGVIGGSLFQNVVLTIDSQRKKITMSQPYRPTYLKLNSRINAELLTMGAGMQANIYIGDKTFPCIIDTWNTGIVELTRDDFAKIQGTSTTANACNNYEKQPISTPAKTVEQCQFVNDTFKNVIVKENPSLKKSVIGSGILQHGILSVDYLHQTVYFQRFEQTEVIDEIIEDNTTVVPGKVNEITGAYFKKNIHDYRQGTDFIFKGDKPVIIDFWATWCGPCKQMAPIFEKWAKQYKDKIIFMKINADKERELCNKFHINALPTFMILPVNGNPIIEVGAKPEKLQKIISELLSSH